MGVVMGIDKAKVKRPPTVARLRKLLARAAAALQEEADAGDLDHPIIRDHARLAREIRKVLQQ